MGVIDLHESDEDKNHTSSTEMTIIPNIEEWPTRLVRNPEGHWNTVRLEFRELLETGIGKWKRTIADKQEIGPWNPTHILIDPQCWCQLRSEKWSLHEIVYIPGTKTPTCQGLVVLVCSGVGVRLMFSPEAG